jgi:hypothetical protein
LPSAKQLVVLCAFSLLLTGLSNGFANLAKPFAARGKTGLFSRFSVCRNSRNEGVVPIGEASSISECLAGVSRFGQQCLGLGHICQEVGNRVISTSLMDFLMAGVQADFPSFPPCDLRQDVMFPGYALPIYGRNQIANLTRAAG